MAEDHHIALRIEHLAPQPFRPLRIRAIREVGHEQNGRRSGAGSRRRPGIRRDLDPVRDDDDGTILTDDGLVIGAAGRTARQLPLAVGADAVGQLRRHVGGIAAGRLRHHAVGG